MTKPIEEHEGKKYLHLILDATNHHVRAMVDVYAVLEAFEVTCPARQHAIKKLLCAGDRDKGSALDDLIGAEAAISRAIELEEGRHNVSHEAGIHPFGGRLVGGKSVEPSPEVYNYPNACFTPEPNTTKPDPYPTSIGPQHLTKNYE